MTGPEHYAAAESDLEYAAHASDKGHQDDVTYFLASAHVHAALAEAAAWDRIWKLDERVRRLEEADETDDLKDRIAEIERRGTT